MATGATTAQTESSSASSFQSMDAEASEMPAGKAAPAAEPCPKTIKKKLRIALRDFGFALFTGLDYELEVEGSTFSGNSGDSGVIEQEVTAAAKTAKLYVWTDAGEETLPVVWDLSIGELDPIAVDTGAKQRLKNLSVFWEGTTATAPALHDFQGLRNLDSSDAMESKTTASLGDAYSQKKETTEDKQQWVPPVLSADDLKEMKDAPAEDSFFKPGGGR